MSDLHRAADVLEEYARMLAETHSEAGVWQPDPWAQKARKDHDEFRQLANRLRKMLA